MSVGAEQTQSQETDSLSEHNIFPCARSSMTLLLRLCTAFVPTPYSKIDCGNVIPVTASAVCTESARPRCLCQSPYNILVNCRLCKYTPSVIVRTEIVSFSFGRSLLGPPAPARATRYYLWSKYIVVPLAAVAVIIRFFSFYRASPFVVSPRPLYHQNKKGVGLRPQPRCSSFTHVYKFFGCGRFCMNYAFFGSAKQQ